MKPSGGLGTPDIAILVGFFALSLAAGFYFGRRAARGIDDYFLGGRRIPWWVLGMSGSASNFDMTGTMVMVSFVFAIGLQGLWVAMRGGMCLPLAMLMIFMGKWLRRSEVMTSAEWMELRFGSGSGGRAARLLSACSNLVVAIAFLTYFVEGSGKFLAVFLPFSPEICSLIMVAVALVYTVLSGLYGVVVTDVLQELLMLAAAIFVGIKAATLPDHAAVLASAGAGWSSFIPHWTAGPMNWLEDPFAYRMFGLCIVFWMARGLLEGAGGLTGGYMPQRYYAARNEREAGLMTAEWVGLLFFRWALIAGAAVLALSLAGHSGALAGQLAADPERALPLVLEQALPAGLRGLLVAGLVAAAMSTFDSTVNAGAAYWVRDIYQRHLRPEADQAKLVRQSRLATLVLALAGVGLALGVHNIDEIWAWITGPLSAGLFAPILLRWYWWRFNGWGFAVSSGAGLLLAIVIKLVAPGLGLYLSFPLIWSVSLLAGVATSLFTRATPKKVLEHFWLKVRPYGRWRPALDGVAPGKLSANRRTGLGDIGRVAAALGWQLAGVAVVVSLVLHKWDTLAAAALVFILLGGGLYFSWYRRLER